MSNNKKLRYPLCVSLGPGDAELITLKTYHALQDSNIIYCPFTQVGEKILSRAKDILNQLGIENDKIKLFNIPMNKNRTFAEKVYDIIAEEISEKYRLGLKVSFVAEGDVGFYSSVQYILDRLESKGIPVERIAGVPAFLACGAYAGIHVVKQDERLSVFPSNISVEEIKEQLKMNNSIVLMKLSQQQEQIKQAVNLITDAEFHYFENIGITKKEFYTCDIKLISDRQFPYFSIMIIKKKEKI